MKRWVLDAIVGVGSLILFLVFNLLLPRVFSGAVGYLAALLLFVIIIATGGYLIRDVKV